MRSALDACDMVVLSGGTSKGAGDLSHRIVSRLGAPGMLVHGVALKPGKPLCLAVIDGKPLAVLPGFPTSAIFTFHAFVAPVIRARAGLPPEAARSVEADVPVRIAVRARPQGIRAGRAGRGRERAGRVSDRKGSGSVTSFSQADGFLEIDALAHRARCRHPRTRHADRRRPRALPDLVDHGQPLTSRSTWWSARWPSSGFSARTHRGRQPGRRGGGASAANAISRRCIWSIRRPASTTRICCAPGLALVKGWQRMQGFVFRPGDARFAGRSAADAIKAALADATA